MSKRKFNNNKEARTDKMRRQKKFKKGAASFYIVAMATLILGIIAASFATVVIQEVSRSANSDLKSSAYDAALAGVADGQLAYANYQRCKNEEAAGNGGWEGLEMASGFTCKELVDWVDNGIVPSGEDERDLVPNALDRTVTYDEGTGEKLGVLVQGSVDSDVVNSEEGSDMRQFYTYVKLETQTEDVLGTLNSTQPNRSFRLKFRGDNVDPNLSSSEESTSPYANSTKGVDDIDTIRVSWHSATEDSDSRNGWAFDWMPVEDSEYGGAIGPYKATPAVVRMNVVQTGKTFNLTDFDQTKGSETDRGTILMIPTDKKDLGLGGEEKYAYAYNSAANKNEISAADGLLKSNDKNYKNLPFVVYCDYKLDYACSADIGLPRPIGGTRSDQTFVVSLSLPYAQPQTHFKVEFFSGGEQVILDGVQVRIDSTGRASDVFARVDARLESSEAAYPYPIMGLEVLGGNSDPAINKNFYSGCEWSDITDKTGGDCLNNSW